MRPRASDAGVWVNCQASTRLASLFPDLDPDAAHRVEGREWHSVGETLLKTGELTGTVEQQEGAVMLAESLAELAPLKHWRSEIVVPCSAIHPEIPDGKPDASFMDRDWIRVADYKCGNGYVDEYENWQCLACLCAMAKREGIDLGTRRCSITIVQPRYFGRHPRVRTWEFPAAHLPRYEAVLAKAAELTRKGEAPARVGPWCGKCAGARGCGTLNQAAGAIAEWADVTRPFDPEPQWVGAELRMLQGAMKMLKARADAMEEQALHLLGKGRAVPGFEMGEVASRETIPAENRDKVLALGQMLKVDLAKPAEPLSPNQARAKLREKGIDEAVIKPYCSRPAGARKLLPVDFNHTKRIFSNGE